MSKAARSLGVKRRAGKLYDMIYKLYEYVLSSLQYCAPVWMSLAESHLGLLNSIVRSEKKLCHGELCGLGHRRKVSASRLLYKIHHRVDHSKNEYLTHFVAARNTRASAALGELTLAIPHCRTYQY